MTFATITGAAFAAYGPAKTGAKASITLTPIYLEAGDEIVMGSERTIGAQPDGTFGPVSLWPGIWRIKLPNGNVAETYLKADTTYDLIELGGVDLASLGGLVLPDAITDGQLLARSGDTVVGVDPASLQDGGLELPGGVAEGQLLARSGDTVVGVDPASLGGGDAGAAALPNWFNSAASPTTNPRNLDVLPGMFFDNGSGVTNFVNVYKEWTYFCGFMLTAPGVATRFRCPRLPRMASRTAPAVSPCTG